MVAGRRRCCAVPRPIGFPYVGAARPVSPPLAPSPNPGVKRPRNRANSGVRGLTFDDQLNETVDSEVAFLLQLVKEAARSLDGRANVVHARLGCHCGSGVLDHKMSTGVRRLTIAAQPRAAPANQFDSPSRVCAARGLQRPVGRLPISGPVPCQRQGGESPPSDASLSFPRAWRTQSSRDTVGGVRAQALRSTAMPSDVSVTLPGCAVEPFWAFGTVVGVDHSCGPSVRG